MFKILNIINLILLKLKVCEWYYFGMAKHQTVSKYWDMFLGRKSFGSTVSILRERWKNKMPSRLMPSWIMQRDHFKSEPGARSGEASAPGLCWLLNLEHFLRGRIPLEAQAFHYSAQTRWKNSLLYEIRIYFLILWLALKISDTNSYKGQNPRFPEEPGGHLIKALWNGVNGYMFY